MFASSAYGVQPEAHRPLQHKAALLTLLHSVFIECAVLQCALLTHPSRFTQQHTTAVTVTITAIALCSWWAPRFLLLSTFCARTSALRVNSAA